MPTEKGRIMVEEMTVAVLCPYCAIRMRVAPPEGDAPLQHLIVCCKGTAGDGCGHYYAVRFECQITYWAQTAPLVFGEEEKLGPHQREPHGLPCG